MGVRLYARDDEEESESFSRSKFTGDPLDYAEWAFKMRSLIRSKKDNPWEHLFASKPSHSFLTVSFDDQLRIDIEASKRAGAAIPWEGIPGNDAAKTKVIRQSVEDFRTKEKKKYDAWTVGQRRVFDTLCLNTEGQASQLLQGIDDGDGRSA